MKSNRLQTLLSSALLFGSSVAQVQNDIGGNYWLNTTVPAPRSFLIGNNPMPFPFESILNVRGDWMTNLTLGLRGEVFRTRSGWYTDLNDAFGLGSNWRMLRASGPDDDDRMEMGKISCSYGLTGDPGANRGFVITAMRNAGSLWLRNRRGRPNYDDPTEEAQNDEPSGNGFRLIDDSSAVSLSCRISDSGSWSPIA